MLFGDANSPVRDVDDGWVCIDLHGRQALRASQRRPPSATPAHQTVVECGLASQPVDLSYAGEFSMSPTASCSANRSVRDVVLTTGRLSVDLQGRQALRASQRRPPSATCSPD